MLGFFSCGKEAVVELPSSVTEGTVSNRDLGECECEMKFLSIANNDADPSNWKFFNNGTELIFGILGEVQNAIEDRSLFDDDVFQIDDSGVFSISVFLGNDHSINPDFAVNVEVTCARENGGAGLITTHTFNFSEAGNCEVDNEGFLNCSWNEDFYCEHQTADDDLPCIEGFHPNWPDC